MEKPFPDDSSTKTTYQEPKGPVLNGVLLAEPGAGMVETPTIQSVAVAASVIFTPGVAAAATASIITATVVDETAPRDGDRPRNRTLDTEEHPVAVILCYGGGGSLIASEGVVMVKGATDHDWRAPEGVRGNGLDEGVRLIRTRPGVEACAKLLSKVCPSVNIGTQVASYPNQDPEEQRPRQRA